MNMNSLKLNIGVLGCADIAKKFIFNSIKESNHFNLYAIATLNFKKHENYLIENNIKFVDNYSQLIEDINVDIIYIPLPNSLHYEWAKKALLRDKHVIVEKPMTTMLSDNIDLNKIAKERNLALFENFQFRFHSQLYFIKDLLNKDIIGDLKFIRSDFCFPFIDDKNNIRYNKKLGGGALFDTGVYPLKISQLFLGYDLKVLNSKLIYSNKYEVDVGGFATFEQKSNGIFSQIYFGFDSFYRNSIELFGTKGKIVAERIFTSPPNKKAEVVIHTIKGKEIKVIESQNHFENMLNYFKELIKNDDLKKEEYLNNINQSKLLDILNKKKIYE
jgi:NDP-hexose-3-ketoreductase